jgi:hypothetical protein
MLFLKMNRSAAEPQPTRLVGAPLVGALHKGTHEGCPYETWSFYIFQAAPAWVRGR